jgi:hypothetical protein
MTVLAWLAIPLAATLVAIVWAYFAARPRRTKVLDTMAAYERFRAAMASGSPPVAGEAARRPAPPSRR